MMLGRNINNTGGAGPFVRHSWTLRVTTITFKNLNSELPKEIQLSFALVGVTPPQLLAL